MVLIEFARWAIAVVVSAIYEDEDEDEIMMMMRRRRKRMTIAKWPGDDDI